PWPLTKRYGDRSWSSLQDAPNVGAPEVTGLSALSSRTTFWVKTEPSALATPSTPRTEVRVAAGIVGTNRPTESASTAGEISTSDTVEENSSLKVLLSVSVNTNVPATKATPMTTARA